MEEEIKTTTCSVVAEHQKQRWHGSCFDHEATMGGERGSCSFPHKKTLAHRCKEIQRRRVDMDIVDCAHTITHRIALSHGELFDAHLCLYLRRSQTVTRVSRRCAAV